MYLEQLILNLRQIDSEITSAIKNKTFLENKVCELDPKHQTLISIEIEREIHRLINNCYEALASKERKVTECFSIIKDSLFCAVECLNHYRPKRWLDGFKPEYVSQVHIELPLLSSLSWLSKEFIQGILIELLTDTTRQKVAALLTADSDVLKLQLPKPITPSVLTKPKQPAEPKHTAEQKNVANKTKPQKGTFIKRAYGQAYSYLTSLNPSVLFKGLGKEALHETTKIDTCISEPSQHHDNSPR